MFRFYILVSLRLVQSSLLFSLTQARRFIRPGLAGIIHFAIQSWSVWGGLLTNLLSTLHNVRTVIIIDVVSVKWSGKWCCIVSWLLAKRVLAMTGNAASNLLCCSLLLGGKKFWILHPAKEVNKELSTGFSNKLKFQTEVDPSKILSMRNSISSNLYTLQL